MKRFIIFILFFIFTITTTNSHAFINKRYEWWKIRLKKLESKKLIYQKNMSTEKTIMDLLGKDIETAKNIISIFESNIENDGSLSNETKTYSPGEIKNKIKKIYTPIFNIYLVDMIQNELNNDRKLADVQQIIQNNINKLISNKYHTCRPEVINSIMTEDWKNKDLTSIYNELLLINLINQKDNIYNRYLNSIEQKIISKFEKINFKTNHYELSRTITSDLINFLNNTNLIDEMVFKNNSLDHSWTWTNYKKRLTNELTWYNKISEMIYSDGNAQLPRLRFYYKNPLELDKIVFGKSAINYTNIKSFSGNEKSKNIQDEKTLTIPAFTGIKDSINSMDRLRQKSIVLVNRNPNQISIADIEKGFNKIISFNFNKTKKIFLRNNEKLRLENNQKNPFNFNNEIEFKKSEKIFNNAMKKVTDYKNQSLEFLKWQIDSQKNNNTNPIEKYNNKILSSKRNIKFIFHSIKSSAEIAKNYNNEIHKKFFYIIRNYNSIYKYIINSTDQGKPELRVLNKKQILSLRESKSSFINDLKLSTSKIKKIYKKYINTRAIEQKKLNEGMMRLKKIIAQYEITKLSDSIYNYLNAFENINYSEDAFTRYIKKYYELEKEARSGNLTIELNDALKIRTIIPIVKNFQKDTILKELNLKTKLKSEIKTSIARIITLLNYYKRNNVEILDHISMDDIRLIKEKINKKVGIKIASWNMNEYNFNKVDKKIVHMLQYILNRQMSTRGNNKSQNSKSNEMSINFNNMTMNFNIPAGWRESKINSTDKRNCILKLIKSPSREEIIEVIKINKDKNTLRDLTEIWAKKSGLEMIKIKWGTKKTKDYFWMLSRDKYRNISEVYSISHNNQTFIIRGKSTRDKYRYLKSTLNSFFLSLNF